MIGIVAHGAVACPEDLPVRLKECAVECFKMEEGVVAPIRTIDGVVEIGNNHRTNGHFLRLFDTKRNVFSSTGSVIINVTDTTVTIDTRHQITIAITEIGIEETDPIRINEGTYPFNEFGPPSLTFV